MGLNLKSQKFKIIVMAVVLVMAVSSFAAQSQAKDYVVPKRTHPCPEDPTVMVNLGGIKLAVPRYPGAILRLKDGTKQTIRDNCWLHSIDDAASIKLGILINGQTLKYHGWFQMTTPSKKNFGSWYKLNKNVIEKAQQENRIEALPDGVQYIKYGYFILPLAKAPTQNNEPVFISCTGNRDQELDKREFSINSCDSLYTHPLGFSVSYRFGRGNFPRYSDYLEVDQAIRTQINNMIKEAQLQSGKKKEKNP